MRDIFQNFWNTTETVVTGILIAVSKSNNLDEMIYFIDQNSHKKSKTCMAPEKAKA